MARIPKKDGGKRTTTYDLEWGDPPKQIRKGVWVERLAPLVERPGVSARVAQGKRQNITGLAGNLRGGNVIVPEGVWEFVVRTIDAENEVAGLWATYKGDGGSEGEEGDGDGASDDA